MTDILHPWPGAAAMGLAHGMHIGEGSQGRVTQLHWAYSADGPGAEARPRFDGDGPRPGAALAAKWVPTSDRDEEDVFWEVSNLRDLAGHPNIVRLWAAAWAPSCRNTVLIMELGVASLHQFTKQQGKLARGLARQFTQDLWSGVGACHSKGIIHRDVAPKNAIICLDGAAAVLKLCDFGASIKAIVPLPLLGRPPPLSEADSDTTRAPLRQRRCTVPYAAPEVLRGDGASPAADVWSAAVVSWELFDDYPYRMVGPNVTLEDGVLTTVTAAVALLELLAIDFPSKVPPDEAGDRRLLLDVLGQPHHPARRPSCRAMLRRAPSSTSPSTLASDSVLPSCPSTAEGSAAPEAPSSAAAASPRPKRLRLTRDWQLPLSEPPSPLRLVKAGKAVLDHLEPCDVEGYCQCEALVPGQWHHSYVAALAQYPLVVAHYSKLASQLPRDHTALQMMEVCHNTVIYAAEHQGDYRMRAHMELLDSTAGYCKGLARVMQRLGVVQRVDGEREQVREGYYTKVDGERRWAWHPTKKVTLGKADPPAKYQLLYDVTRLESLLAACRAAPTDPGGADCRVLQEPMRTQADLIRHMTAFIDMLARWPPELHVHPPRTKKDKALPSRALPPINMLVLLLN